MNLNKPALHIAFWLAVTALLTLGFASSFGGYRISFYFTAMLLPVVVGTSYFFNYYLVPRYLLEKSYGRFALYLAYMLVVSFWAELLVIFAALAILADYNIRNLGPMATNVFVMGLALYFIVLLKAFLLLVRRSYLAQSRTRELRKEKNKFLEGSITVRADRKQAKLLYREILYLESIGDYVKIHRRQDAPVITRERISSLEEQLPETFLRIHRSFIINTDKIETFSRTEIHINGHELPISRTYKDEVLDRLEANRR